ncbi:protein-tyrosine phosphatase [Rhodococcus sp. 27YEA15]|uniref:tyrosine-protein phosphatase n=1 Tax=Rhodococcus sp. 27YEA15 TaxID=3156259 RepID=UPI003C7A97AD
MTDFVSDPVRVDVSPDPVNLRDIGGFDSPLGPVRTGVALRSDDLSSMSQGFAAGLVAGGLRTVIDLRSHAEVSQTGRGPLAALDLTYHHVPLLESAASPAHLAGHFGALTPQQVGAWYVEVVESAASRLVLCLNIIAISDGATAFHCAAGKDRTGILAAMLLSCVGADPERIVSDYSATEANLDAIIARMRHTLGSAAASEEEYGTPATNALMGAVPATMVTMLEIFDARGQSPLDPLYAAGLDESVVRRLRTRLLG